MAVICPSCGIDNRAGRRFCAECAAPLAVNCPNCAAANEPGEKFCGECAAPLAGDVPAARDAAEQLVAAPVAERRVVTVLFADLVGFTPYAEARDAETVRETLSVYFDAARGVVAHFDGTIEKFIGDAVMAVWGAPIAHEDDAERAVRAALELCATLPGLGSGIGVRVGVNTGEAAVTIGAVGEGMVAGDVVNTAARLQAAAMPGTVLVAEATRRAAEAVIVFEPAGEQSLKGKAVPLATWRALRVRAPDGDAQQSARLVAPFVGRAHEMRLLSELFEASTTERRLRLVSVVGPAGVGKSRLAAEFEQQSRSVEQQVLWHHGRSPAYGEGVTFWALGEMVRQRVGLSEGEDEAATRAKVGAAVELYVAPPERAWVVSALLALLGRAAGNIRAEELMAAWRTFFEGLCSIGAVVLVFEDLQWADHGLIDFIDHMLEWSRRQPLFILTLARPELLERRADWGAGKREFTSLALEPLPPTAMSELLHGLVPGLPAPVTRSIIERADGIPLYAVEMVRMLLADGSLRAIDGRYEPAREIVAPAIPDTLAALIESRLDGFEPADRALVKDAAVLGQWFSLDALAAVSGATSETLEPRLRGLVRRELLTLELDPRSPERGQYGFVQSLIREVAYNTLARRERMARHLAAARYYESVASGELVAVLASHYLAAYRSAPDGPQAETLRAQAAAALRAAAERAARLGSHDQAISLLAEAQQIATTPAERADLLSRAGASATAAAHDAKAEELYRRAIDLRRELGDRAALAQAVADLGAALNNAYRSVAARELLGHWQPALADLGDIAPTLALRAQLARADFLLADYRPAIAACDAMLEAAEQADLVEIVADVLVTRGGSLCGIGRTYEGMGALIAAENLADRHDLGNALSRAIGNRASFLGVDDPRAGLEVSRRLLALERRMGKRHPQAVNLLCAYAFRTGDWDDAEREIEAALPDATDVSLRSSLLTAQVGFRAARGEPFAETVDQVIDLVGHDTEPYHRVNVEVVNQWRALMSGNLEAASRHARALGALIPDLAVGACADEGHYAAWSHDAAGVRDALARLNQTGVRGQSTQANRLVMQAAVAALEGDLATAFAGYRRALDLWRNLGLAWEEALLGLDMAETIGPAEAEVHAAAAASRQIMARLRAAPFAERLERAMATSVPTWPEQPAVTVDVVGKVGA